MKLATLEISFGNKPITFSYRNQSLGDKGVVKQIFQNSHYNIAHWPQGKRFVEYFHEHTQNQQGLIIDAGANIGASAVYFLEIYNNSYVYAIEPDREHVSVLTLNTQPYEAVQIFHGAIAGQDGDLYLEDPGLSDWGFRTHTKDQANSESVKVSAISPKTILQKTKHMKPMMFKIDIEGGEESLFEGDTSWMREFPLLIIELHDWMLPFSGSSKNFFKAIAQYEFDFVHKGENIFLFNRELLC